MSKVWLRARRHASPLPGLYLALARKPHPIGSSLGLCNLRSSDVIVRPRCEPAVLREIWFNSLQFAVCALR